MKKLIAFSIFVLTYFSLATICQAQDSNKRFSFKLTVGYGSMAVGDINAVLESQENLLSYFASFGGTKAGELKELNRGFEYEGEFIINITEHFGLGIGAGYILRKEQSKVSLGYVGSSHNHEISANCDRDYYIFVSKSDVLPNFFYYNRSSFASITRYYLQISTQSISLKRTVLNTPLDLPKTTASSGIESVL